MNSFIINGGLSLSLLYFIFLCPGIYGNCDSEIYCRGPILEKIQLSGLFRDSKQFVDMPTSKSKAVVLKNFSELRENVTKVELQSFLSENFRRPGYEMRMIIPKDWKRDVKFINLIQDEKLKAFGKTIHEKWKGLTRRFDQRRLCPDCLGSSLKLPYPFIVPGGRFREFYYWDSYWILEGLYVSEMCSTAAGMIENMLIMIKELGFVPNGARIYYMNRSQPPLLVQMVKRYLEECFVKAEKGEEEKKAFLMRVLPLLEKEYSFWMRERSCEIDLKEQGGGVMHKLNLYRAEHWIPRPESFIEDKSTASLPNFNSELSKQKLYQNIASAAESGWDFSGRWLNETTTIQNSSFPGISSIKTVLIVPVDLNVFMLENEKVLSDFFASIDDQIKANEYKKRGDMRRASIEKVFHSGASIWCDFDLEFMRPLCSERRIKSKSESSSEASAHYISDLSPVWYYNFTGEELRHILKSNEKILFEYPGGIPASDALTGEQWDFPNVWAPIQYLFMKTLLKHDEGKGGEFYEKALNVAQRFINSTYCGYELFGQVFEKYHAVSVGHPGGGGEYIVQEGFGWTNGVILWTLKTFASNLTAPHRCVKHNRLQHRPTAHLLQTSDYFETLRQPVPEFFVLKKRSFLLIFHFIVNLTLLIKYH